MSLVGLGLSVYACMNDRRMLVVQWMRFDSACSCERALSSLVPLPITAFVRWDRKIG
jgi:hypothetical protein